MLFTSEICHMNDVHITHYSSHVLHDHSIITLIYYWLTVILLSLAHLKLCCQFCFSPYQTFLIFNCRRWGHWYGPEEDRYDAMKYENGQNCWNGPNRICHVSGYKQFKHLTVRMAASLASFPKGLYLIIQCILIIHVKFYSHVDIQHCCKYGNMAKNPGWPDSHHLCDSFMMSMTFD